MAINPFSYTVKDYDTILAEIDTLFPNRPDWFKNTLAGRFAIAHWYLDARAQNLLLSSAFTPESILNLAAFIDYYPKSLSPSSSQLVVKLSNTVTLPYTLPVSQQAFSVSNTATNESINVIGTEEVTFSTGRYAKVKVQQGDVTPPFRIGASTETPFQEVAISDDNIQYDTIKVYLATSTSPLILAEWTKKDTLVNSFSTDEHFRVIKKPSNILVIQFGNGEYGKIPPIDTEIYMSYVSGGGIVGNIKAGGTVLTNTSVGTSTGTSNQSFDVNQKIVISETVVKVSGVVWFGVVNLEDYGSTDKVYTITLLQTTGMYRITFGDGVNGQIPANGAAITITSKLSDNATVSYIGGLASSIETSYVYEDFTGGAAAETIEATRFLAPLSIKSLEKAVIEEDFEYLSRRFSTSVSSVKCFPQYYGPGTVGVHIIPAGGGNPSTTLKATLGTYLNERTPLSAIDVRVRNPVYIPRATDINPLYRSMSIEATLYLKQGFNTVTYSAYGNLVLRLLVSEVTTELLNIYDSEGISSAVDFINSKWNFNDYIFTSADYNEIVKIFERRSKDGILLWGGRLRPNDVISGLTDLSGADYAEVTQPSAIITLPFDRVFSDKDMSFNLTVQVS